MLYKKPKRMLGHKRDRLWYARVLALMLINSEVDIISHFSPAIIPPQNINRIPSYLPF